MSVGLYTDVHVPRPITRGLRRRGVDMLTSQEDGTTRWSDSDLVDRATELGRILFSQDHDMLVEAAQRQLRNIPFAGLIFGPELGVSIGGVIDDLEILAKAGVLADFSNLVHYLPLR